jgi:hypothetical protein
MRRAAAPLVGQATADTTMLRLAQTATPLPAATPMAGTARKRHSISNRLSWRPKRVSDARKRTYGPPYCFGEFGE